MTNPDFATDILARLDHAQQALRRLPAHTQDEIDAVLDITGDIGYVRRLIELLRQPETRGAFVVTTYEMTKEQAETALMRGAFPPDDYVAKGRALGEMEEQGFIMVRGTEEEHSFVTILKKALGESR
jgi:hypothetical protein